MREVTEITFIFERYIEQFWAIGQKLLILAILLISSNTYAAKKDCLEQLYMFEIGSGGNEAINSRHFYNPNGWKKRKSFKVASQKWAPTQLQEELITEELSKLKLVLAKEQITFDAPKISMTDSGTNYYDPSANEIVLNQVNMSTIDKNELVHQLGHAVFHQNSTLRVLKDRNSSWQAGYEDFFADVVKVLNTNSLADPIRSRNFEVKLAAQGWNDHDEIQLFRPAKKFIADRLLKKVIDPNNPMKAVDRNILKAKIINKLMNVLESEELSLIRLNSQKDTLDLAYTPEELNLRLIDSLRQMIKEI